MEKPRPLIAPNRGNPSDNFKLFHSGEELLEDVASEAKQLKPGDKFWVKGMYVASGTVMGKITPLLETAVTVGADVKVYADPISILAPLDLPHYIARLPYFGIDYQKQAKSILAGTYELFSRLQENPGIDFDFTTDQTLLRRVFPFAGADHRKGIFIGGTAYILNDNIDDRSMLHMDSASMKITDPHLSAHLANEVMKQNPQDGSTGHTTIVDQESSIVVDHGDRNRSFVYKAAIDAVKRAGQRQGFIGIDVGHLIGGDLLDEIIRASTLGATVEIVMSSTDTMAGATYVVNRLSQKRLLSNSPRPRVHIVKDKQLHAKIMVTDTEVIFGSHNFIELGMRLGTQEVDLQTSAATAIANTQRYHDELMSR